MLILPAGFCSLTYPIGHGRPTDVRERTYQVSPWAESGLVTTNGDVSDTDTILPTGLFCLPRGFVIDSTFLVSVSGNLKLIMTAGDTNPTATQVGLDPVTSGVSPNYGVSSTGN